MKKTILLSLTTLVFIVFAAQAESSELNISVEADGIYLLSYSDLQNAGLNPSGIDPRTIRVTNNGAGLPIYVYGEDDGVFDTTDYMEFYGAAIPRGSSAFEFTTTNVYRLMSGGAQGLRMSTRDGTPSGSATVPASFGATKHEEADTYYWQSLPDGDGRDHWFWDDKISAGDRVYYTFTLSNISTTNATVRVSLQGRTDTAEDPDHNTRIYLNNVEIDDRSWNGQVELLHEAAGVIKEGTNTLMLRSMGGTGASTDMTHMDWFEVDYRDTFVAESDSLDFTVTEPGTFEFRVSGFSGNSVEVFDITDRANVIRVANNTTSAGTTP